MKRSFQARWHSRCRRTELQRHGNMKSLRYLVTVYFLLPENKKMCGDMPAPGSVRLTGQAVSLGCKHFKVNRPLKLPQTEGDKGSLCSLPQGSQARRILKVNPTPWEDKCVSFPDHTVSLSGRIQMICA